MSIEQMYVISTAHITQETAEALDGELGERLTMNPSEYGWMILVDVDDDLPLDLKQCMREAERRKCKWLLLDRDGPKEYNLTQYEW